MCVSSHGHVWFANQQFFGACLPTPPLPSPPPPPGKQAGGGKQKRSHCEGEATGLFLLWEEMHTNVLPVRPPPLFSSVFPLVFLSPMWQRFSLSPLLSLCPSAFPGCFSPCEPDQMQQVEKKLLNFYTFVWITFFFLFLFHQSFSGDSTPTHKLTEKKRKKNKNKLTQICSIKIYKRETLTGQLMVTQLSGCWVVCLCVCISLKLSWDGFVEEDRGEWIRCVLQRVYSLRIV